VTSYPNRVSSGFETHHSSEDARNFIIFNEATVWMETHRPRPQRWMMVALPQSQRIGAVGSNPTCFAFFNMNLELKNILENQAWDDEFYAAMLEKSQQQSRII
jgi:hypothetical protein